MIRTTIDARVRFGQVEADTFIDVRGNHEPADRESGVEEGYDVKAASLVLTNGLRHALQASLTLDDDGLIRFDVIFELPGPETFAGFIEIGAMSGRLTAGGRVPLDSDVFDDIGRAWAALALERA